MYSYTNKTYILHLQNKLHRNIKKANVTCKTNPLSKSCAIAWDQVEDIQKGLHIMQKRNKHTKTDIDFFLINSDSDDDLQYGEVSMESKQHNTK